MKKYLPILIALVILLLGGLAAFILIRRPSSTAEPTVQNKRQIINALPYDQRPFVALFPHPTNKLITLLVDKAVSDSDITIDIEYMSGNSLKGGRTTLALPFDLPHTQAFLLGSCSAGGKCSFDEDITTGTIKTKLEKGDELHVLKSNFVFLADERTATTDQKAAFTPARSLTGPVILGQTHGFLGQVDGELSSEPIAITTTSAKALEGKLELIAPDTQKVLIYDGKTYQPLKFTTQDNKIVIDLSLTPRERTVNIIRDDLQGAEESTDLFIVGPIVTLK